MAKAPPSADSIPVNYVFMLIDSNWGHNYNYYPEVVQRSVRGPVQLAEFVADAIQHLVEVDDEDEDEDEDEDAEGLMQPPDRDAFIAHMIKTNCRSFFEGVKWACGTALLAKDASLMYNRLVRAGQPGPYAGVI